MGIQYIAEILSDKYIEDLAKELITETELYLLKWARYAEVCQSYNISPFELLD